MSKSMKTLLLWGLLILMFVAIWQFLSPEETLVAPRPLVGGSWTTTAGLAGVLFAAVFGLVRVGRAGAAHNVALQASIAQLEAGRFDEAERGLDGVIASRLPQYRRAAQLQRAEIAARRGDRDEALARVELAIAGPVGRMSRAGVRVVVLAARGLRAFLRASAGDTAGAREDIAAVLAEREAEPRVTARAILAEALILDRGGDRAGLRDLLERSRPLLLQACPQRERALVKAYEAMLDAGSASVYRKQAAQAAAPDDHAAVADWVARYAPGAAPFVRGSSADPAGPVGRGGPVATVEPEAPAVEEPSADARRRVAAARPSKMAARTSMKSAALWTASSLLFAGIWMFAVVEGQSLGAWAVYGFPAAALVAWVALGFRNGRRQRADARRLRAAVHAYGSGDLERASEGFAFVPRAPLHRTQAANFEAEIALSRGEPERALAACDRALAALVEAHQGKLAPPAPPPAGTRATWDYPRVLATQRAVALAALGRHDEALAELAWANGLPTELPRLHVRLIKRLRAQHYATAARLLEAREPGLLPSAREEVLFELVRFVGRPAARSEGEAARLRAEMRRIVDLPRWLEMMAPGLDAAFEAAAQGAAGATAAGAL